MADNAMSNTYDPETKIAALGERVEGQGRRLSSLEATVTQGFKQVEVSIGSLSSEFRNSQRPQWQAIGVALTFATVVGALAYWPIRENQSQDRTAIDRLADNSLSVASFIDFKNTYENNRVVSRQDYIDKFGALTARLEKIDDAMVPRAELNRIFNSYDQQLSDKQRQIDEMKAVAGGVYNQRDVIRDILERLDRAEHKVPLPPPAG